MTHRNHAKVTKVELVASLRSRVCPACSEKKSSGHTFCGGCYGKLTRPVQLNLYRRLGEGYEAAIQAAWAELNPEQFHHAPPAERKVR